MAKGNTLGAAFDGLRAAANQPAQAPAKPVETAKTAKTSLDIKKPPIGVMFRLNPPDHDIVTKYADQKGWSVQELLENAVNQMRRSEGLAEIKGRPRGKKAGEPTK